MDILIIGKWATPKYIDGNWPEPAMTTAADVDPNDNWNKIHYSAPIITTFIDIFLSVADNTQEVIVPGMDEKQKQLKYFYIYGDSQKGASLALLAITFIMVPVLLCTRPLVVKFTSKKHDHGAHVEVHKGSVQYDKIPEGKGITRNERYEQIVEILEKENMPAEHHDFGEVFIH